MADPDLNGSAVTDRLVRARATSADGRGRFTLGAGAVLHDGMRMLRLLGCERDQGGELLAVLDVDGTITRLPFAQLCSDTATLAPIVGHGGGEPVPGDPLWEGLPRAEQEAVMALARHLRQVLTGSPDGNLERAIALGRVDPRYDPRVVSEIGDRLRSKSKELRALGVPGAAVPSLKRKLESFRVHGAMGLVDKRWLRRKDPLDGVPSEVLDVVGATVAAQLAGARLSARKLIALSRSELNRAEIGQETTPNQLRVIVGELSRGRAMHRESRSRATNSNRPERVYGRLLSNRPGEIVQIDATPSNTHVWFPDAGWCPATILTAIDTYSRQILALRVVPGAISTRDTSLLLWDICQRQVPRCGWPRELRRWHGMPVLVQIDSEQTRLPNERPSAADRLVGEKRAVPASTVVIDHGGEFDAEHFLSVCARNGIDVIFARPRTATDKGIVESWHYTLDQALRLMPGYKGANPQDHPRTAETDAALTCADLQDMVWTWILTVYHDTPHEGLRDPANPRIRLSPNMAFDRFIEVGGHVEVSHDPYRLINFLSCKPDATIQSDGIHLMRRTFVNERVVELGARMQRGVGAKARPIPVYYDRWDLTRLYLHDPFAHEWVCVPAATPGGTAIAPFSEAITRAAIEDTIRGKGPTSNTELHRREVELLAAFSSGVFPDRRERRLHALETSRQTTFAGEIETWSQEMRELAFPPTPARPDEGLEGFDDAEQDDAEVFGYDNGDDVDGLAL